MMRDDSAKKLGRFIKEGLGIRPEHEHAESCRAAVFQAMDRLEGRKKRRRNTALRFAAAASLIAGCSVVFFLSSRIEGGFGYRVGASDIRTETGWVSNDGSRTLPIVFENGSRFVLDRKSVAKVMEADSKQVRIDLNKGALAAKVNGNGKTKWIVEAGPYTVKVLGTEFQVSWDADTERLNVSVSSGHVSVSGANLGEKGVVLEPGLRLVSDRSGSQISRKTGTAENTEAAPRTGEIGATPALSSVSKIEEVRNPMASMSDTKDEPRAQSTQKTVSTRAIAHLSKSVWRTAVDAEEWATAIDAMDSNAVAEAAAEAESGVLWRLAEEARRLRRTDLSDIFFEAVRTKSQGTDRAATAAFLLGKSAWDMRGDPKTAKKWLDIYLAESPNGTLAEEARGRLMEVNRYMENQDEARRIAIDYLRRYPNGSFAGQAKRIQEHPY